MVNLHSITNDIDIVDGEPILFIKSINALVIADLHLGIEHVMAEEGSFTPASLTDKVVRKLVTYLDSIDPDSLIINGDAKHSFSEPTKIENREVNHFLSSISSHVPHIKIIKGNHDKFITWVTRDIANVELFDPDMRINNYLFTHGHLELPESLDESVSHVFIGHEHPIFSIVTGKLQKVQGPCFAVCPLKNHPAKLIIIPAFTEYSVGTPITPKNDNFLSPILRQETDISNAELYVLSSNQVFAFPPLKEWYEDN